MKNIRRLIFWIVFSILIFILIYLFSKWIVIVKSDYENLNKIFYVIILIVFLYYLLFYVIRPTYIKWFKVINTLIWIWIIYISQYFLANSWIDWIFYWDILCIIWVILTIIWPTNALISKEEQKEKDLEIIEA